MFAQRHTLAPYAPPTRAAWRSHRRDLCSPQLIVAWHDLGWWKRVSAYLCASYKNGQALALEQVAELDAAFEGEELTDEKMAGVLAILSDADGVPAGMKKGEGPLDFRYGWDAGLATAGRSRDVEGAAWGLDMVQAGRWPASSAGPCLQASCCSTPTSPRRANTCVHAHPSPAVQPGASCRCLEGVRIRLWAAAAPSCWQRGVGAPVPKNGICVQGTQWTAPALVCMLKARWKAVGIALLAQFPPCCSAGSILVGRRRPDGACRYGGG